MDTGCMIGMTVIYMFYLSIQQPNKCVPIQLVCHKLYPNTNAAATPNYGYSPKRRYYAINIFAELDSPGEYYVDTKLGLLYFWPPTPINSGA